MVDVCTFSSDNQAVSPVIATILMVSIVVILGAVVSVFALGLTESVSETAPQAQFEFDYDSNVTVTDPNNPVEYYTQVVTITHVVGDSIDSDNLIIRSPDTAFKYIEEDGDLGGFGTNSAYYEDEVTFRQIDGAETMSAGDQVRIAVVYGDSGGVGFCPCDDVDGKTDVNYLNESVVTVNYDRGSGRSATLARWDGQDA